MQQQYGARQARTDQPSRRPRAFEAVTAPAPSATAPSWSPAPPASSAPTSSSCCCDEGVEVVGWQRPGTRPLTSGRHPLGRPSSCWTLPPWSRRSRELQPSAIYHLAGSAHVADSWQHTRETFEGNVLATHHLLQGLRRARARATGARERLGHHLPAAAGSAHRGLAARPVQPLRRQQARAGDGRGAGLARARHSRAGRAIVQPRRPAADAGLRGARRSRGRSR